MNFKNLFSYEASDTTGPLEREVYNARFSALMAASGMAEHWLNTVYGEAFRELDRKNMTQQKPVAAGRLAIETSASQPMHPAEAMPKTFIAPISISPSEAATPDSVQQGRVSNAQRLVAEAHDFLNAQSSIDDQTSAEQLA
jgi:hypothetical protein